MSEKKTDRQVIREAADLLRTRGWCQGRMSDSEGRCCLLGAVRSVAFDMKDPSAVTPADSDYVRWDQWDRLYSSLYSDVSRLTGGSETVVSWNDRKLRTADEVIALLERVAENV